MTLDVRRVVIAGLVSSAIMGMVSMLGEALLGAGLWASPTLIAATLLRDLQTLQAPVPLLVVPFLLGLMGHMMNAVVLTGVFEAAVGWRVSSPASAMVAGAVFGLMVFAVMWLIVLPVINPVMALLNPVVFAVAHVMWGVTLGWLLRR